MCKQQQFSSPHSHPQKIPTTLQLPKIDKRYRKDSASTIQPRSSLFHQEKHHSNLGTERLTSSNFLKLSCKFEDTQLKTDLQLYSNLEKLLAMKTVPFCQNEKEQKESFVKSFKKINQADTSTESNSNKRMDEVMTKRGENYETKRESKVKSCRIINSKKIPFKIIHEAEHSRYARNRSLWNVSRIEVKQTSRFDESFQEQLEEILKQF